MENNAAQILYSASKINLFAHIDFVNRWFKGSLINLKKIKDKRGNTIIDAQGSEFIFRYATFTGFKKVKSGIRLVTVERTGCGDIWILKPNWILETKNYVNDNICKYEELLNKTSLFFASGEVMNKFLSNGRIIKIYE